MSCHARLRIMRYAIISLMIYLKVTYLPSIACAFTHHEVCYPLYDDLLLVNLLTLSNTSTRPASGSIQTVYSSCHYDLLI